jgi:hypothetical protein
MNGERWRQLKKKLTQEKDLAKIWDYYMDHFADHERFTSMGERVENEYLDAVAQAICGQLFGQHVVVQDFLWIHIPEHQFFHGPLQADGRIGGMIYSEPSKTGLLAISAGFPPNQQVKYSRFSKPMELPPKPDRPDLN